MKPFRAILFDLDDTLALEEPAAHEAFVATGRLAQARHGVDPEKLHLAVRRRARELWYAHPRHPYAKRIGISSWEALWARFESEGDEIAELRAFAPTYRRDTWARALADLGVEDDALAEQLASTFPGERRMRHHLFPETLSVLERLREDGRWRLGLITNGLSCLQREKLAGAGLTTWFDAVTVSGDVGAAKPDPLPFRRLLELLGIEADESIMIGNSLEKDVAGARAAGVYSVWIDRGGGGDGSVAGPDARIESLEELFPILARRT